MKETSKMRTQRKSCAQRLVGKREGKSLLIL